jgi:DNA-binding transcriptional regulator YiaG
MINQTSNNWLEPFRQRQNHTQESLATALNRSSKTVSRWENYKTVNKIPYDKLAIELKTDEKNTQR